MQVYSSPPIILNPEFKDIVTAGDSAFCILKSGESGLDGYEYVGQPHQTLAASSANLLTWTSLSIESQSVDRCDEHSYADTTH